MESKVPHQVASEAQQLALKLEAHRLIETGVEGYVVESERLARALTSIEVGELNSDGAAAVIYTARLRERCGDCWEALRLLENFEPAMRQLGDPQMNFTLWLRKARDQLSTGNPGGTLVNLAAALNELTEQTFNSTVTELWMLTAGVWTDIGLPALVLHAAPRMLALETRPSNNDGYQTMAAHMIIEAHAAMGETDLAIQEGLQLLKLHTREAPLFGGAGMRYANLQLSLIRLLVNAGRLAEASEILQTAKAMARPDWPSPSRFLDLMIGACAGAVGDQERLEELTEPFFTGPILEQAQRKIGMRVRVGAKLQTGSTSAAARRAAADRQAMREQRIEQLVAHTQWDLDSGARARRRALMSPARAATWVLDNAAGAAALRYDPWGTRMAVAGRVARQMATLIAEPGIAPDDAEIAARLAMIGYLFVPHRLLLSTSSKDSQTSLAVSVMASQGGRELLGAFDDELLARAAQVAAALRLRPRAKDRTCVMAVAGASPLAQLVAVALVAAEACIGKDGADVSASDLRLAVKRAVKSLDAAMAQHFAALSDAALDQAGHAESDIAASVSAHRVLFNAVVSKIERGAAALSEVSE